MWHVKGLVRDLELGPREYYKNEYVIENEIPGLAIIERISWNRETQRRAFEKNGKLRRSIQQSQDVADYLERSRERSAEYAKKFAERCKESKIDLKVYRERAVGYTSKTRVRE